MIILGVDPGYDRLGVAILKKKNRRRELLLFSSCIETSRTKGIPERLVELGEALTRCIKKWKPEVLAIEALYMNTNQKTALTVAEARGVVMYIASLNNLRVYEFTPQAVKIATTGYGRSTKEQVAKMLPRLVALTDERKRRRDDEYDAIAVALTCAASIR